MTIGVGFAAIAAAWEGGIDVLVVDNIKTEPLAVDDAYEDVLLINKISEE